MQAYTKKAKDTSKVPSWVTPQLFEQLLQNEVANFKEIKDFKAYSALAPGENYSTVMLRIQITVATKDSEEQHLSYMIKVSHDHQLMKKIHKQHNSFKVESTVCQQIVPELEQMYADVGVSVKFGAHSFQIPTENNYVLLEDLSKRDFKNANRLQGLDMQHMQHVLRKLAQYHAASATRIANKGVYPAEYSSGLLNDVRRPIVESMYNGTKAFLLAAMENYKGHEAYIECVGKVHDVAVDELFKFTDVNENEFTVLNHGDLWVNNIMFQYDAAGGIGETYFVDYQIPLYGTPAYDLIYLILSSAHFDIKLQHFDYFIKYYHTHLIEHLKLLRYAKKLPKLRELHMTIIKYGIIFYTSVIGIMAVALLDPNENANFELLLTDAPGSAEFKTLMFANARYKQHAEAIFPWLQNRGLLECPTVEG